MDGVTAFVLALVGGAGGGAGIAALLTHRAASRKLNAEAVEIIERAAASTIARLQAELDEVRAEVKANKAAHDREISYLRRMLRRWREYALGLSGQLRSAGLVPYDDPPAEEDC